MKNFVRFKKLTSLFVVGILAAVGLAACGTDTGATTTASCAWIVGDGQNGHDASIHRIVYPGQLMKADSGETVWYVPCNSRNYIVNDGTVKNANGDVVGDRAKLIYASTTSGVAISIAATAYFTLNEDKPAMQDLYKTCLKYNCASSSDKSGTANYSTPGWNGMLAENFGPTMDAVGLLAAKTVDDSIWKLHDPDQYAKLSDAMSKSFADEMRKKLGYPEDLFCGSGNSGWTDPSKPGQGKFTCSPVRIEVNDVQLVANQSDQNSQGTLTLNQQRLANAQALYGPYAGFWLGLQDSIAQCKAAGVTCVFNIGGSGGPSLPLIADTPTPQPTATPTPGQ